MILKTSNLRFVKDFQGEKFAVIRICRRGNFESFAEFNLAVEQLHYKIIFKQKSNFSIAFRDILKYNHSDRKKKFAEFNCFWVGSEKGIIYE